jgi:VWFA-related protein
MPSFGVSGSRRFAVATACFIVLISVSGTLQAQTETAHRQTPTEAQNQSPVNFRVASNLVVVRVVVRDGKGKPVEGLKKEDFKLFDQGKEQSISQFEVETSAAAPLSPVVAPIPGQAAPPPAVQLAMPGKFLALYFDDINTSDAEMMQARDAADHYLASNLQPKDRLAIFVSGKMLSDFTADPKQIHDALSKLPVARALTHVRECPDLSDYQAYEITQFANDTSTDAWTLALDESRNRHCGSRPNPAATQQPLGGSSPPATDLPSAASLPNVTYEEATPILMLAQRIVAQAETQARSNLQGLERVVNHLSRMPGQRTLVLVSPGFLSPSEQYELDRIIDQALRSQVVISSLDPRGLAMLMREVDVTQNYVSPSGASDVIRGAHNVDSAREAVATDVLAEVAQGTGGKFFHNDNDLKAGFSALPGSPVYYILAFAPSDVKPDGKFHALKVTLSENQKGFSVEARRGYFAAKAEARADMETPQSGTSGPDAQVKEQIRETLLSKAEVQELPVEVRTEVSKGSLATTELSVLAHLDTKSLHFRKEGAYNQNTVTFVCVIFNDGGKSVGGQQQQARVNLPDEALAHLLATGMDIKLTFQLKPGDYTMRAVVTDSEEHHITALSRNMKVP